MSLTKVKGVVLANSVDTITDLATASKGTAIQVLGFHTKGDGGGGVFFYDAEASKTEHNGGTVIDPDKVNLITNWNANQESYFTAATTGVGAWKREYSGAVNVKWFGAKGDGVSYDKISVQSAIDNAYEVIGDHLTYNLANNFISISKPTILKGLKLKVNAQKTAMVISSSNVIIDNVDVNGTSNATYNASGRGIDVTGVDNGAGVAPTYITNVTIRNSKIYNFSFIGIKPNYVDNLVVDNCEIYNIKYAGFGASSCNNSIVKNCNIHDITDGDGLNAYGGYWSQGNSSDEVRYPVCSNCTFDRNSVDGVFWEGLDTHGGYEIKFTNNYISNCGNAIAIIVADDEANSYRQATIRNLVANNTVVNCTIGVGSSSTLDQQGVHYHSGLTIIGNNFRGCGTESTEAGAIRLRSTSGAIVSNNQVSSQLVNGIVTLEHNVGCNITNNLLLDVYSSVYPACAVNIKYNTFSGLVGGNVAVKYQTGLSNNLSRGLNVASDLVAGSLSVDTNRFVVCTTPYNISDANAASITTPNTYTNSGSISVTTAVSSASVNIDLSTTFTSNTIYDPIVSMTLSSLRNVRLRSVRVDTNTFQIIAETTDGSNFSANTTIGYSYIVSGF